MVPGESPGYAPTKRRIRGGRTQTGRSTPPVVSAPLQQRLLRQLHRLLRALFPEGLVLFSRLLVVVLKELLDFFQNPAVHVRDGLDVAVLPRCERHREQTVIPLLLPILVLLGFEHADEPAWYHAAREYRFIHQQQDVNRIAIVRLRARNESKIVRKHHALGQHLRQGESPEVRLVLEFVPAPFRGFYDYVYNAFLISVERLDASGIGQPGLQFLAHLQVDAPPMTREVCSPARKKSVLHRAAGCYSRLFRRQTWQKQKPAAARL